MHLGRLDQVVRGDRTLQLAFHGAELLDVEDELRLAQRIRLVEDFPADRPARRQALFGQHHAGVFDLRRVDEDGGTAAFQRIVDAGRVQLLADRGGFLEIEAGEEKLFAGRAALKHQNAEAAANESDDNKRRRDPHTTGTGELGNQPFSFFGGLVSHARPENSACVAIYD